MSQLWSALSKLPPGVWAAVLVAYVLGHLVGMLKWRLMVNLAGAGLSHRQAAHCYLRRTLRNIVFALDCWRRRGANESRDARFKKPHGHRACLFAGPRPRFRGARLPRWIRSRAAAGLANAASLRVFWSVAVAVAIAGSAVLVFLWLLPVRRFPHKIQRIMVQLRQSWRSMIAKHRYVALALLLGIAVQGWFVFLTAKVADMCGLHVPMHGWLVAVAARKTFRACAADAGRNRRARVALAALLAPFGAKPVLTVAVGLVWEAIIVVTSLLGGLVSFVAGRMKPSGKPTGEARVAGRVLSSARAPLPGSQD